MENMVRPERQQTTIQYGACAVSVAGIILPFHSNNVCTKRASILHYVHVAGLIGKLELF